jgi:GTP-binding protein
MKINSAEYKASYSKPEELPNTKIPEFAFIGRSNVGKSTLLNFLTGRKQLAKTSSKPGKTKAFSFFLINNKFHFVDLPGYGYAKFSRAERKKWEQRLARYFTIRKQLAEVFVLVDSSIPPQQLDINTINFLGENMVPFAIVFTKTDKASKKETEKNISEFKKLLSQTWEELPPMLQVSAIKKTGKEEILQHIEQTLKQIESI